MDVEIIVNEYGDYIFNYALRLCCNPTLAEDLAQETFINAWQNVYTLKNSYAAKAWLRKICLNNYLMYERKNKNYKEIAVEDITILEAEGNLISAEIPEPEEELLVAEEIKELQNGCFLAMARYLTLHQRIAFSLTDMFGLPLEEVAQIMGLSKGAVKGLLFRGRMNLDSFFSNHCSIIDAKNPCSCKAWIEFSKNRDNHQQDAKRHKLNSNLDFKKSNYIFNPEIRSKINYLYKNIPDRKPSEKWYRQVVDIIKNNVD